MHILQRVANFQSDGDHSFGRKGLIVVFQFPFIENLAQRLALHQFHHEKQIGVALNEFDTVNDFGMVDHRQNFGFAAKQAALIFEIFRRTRAGIEQLFDHYKAPTFVACAKNGSVSALSDGFDHLIRAVLALQTFTRFEQH